MPDALERVLVERYPRALYVQNGPHNPTGRLASPVADRRARRSARPSRHHRDRGPRVGRPRLRRPSDGCCSRTRADRAVVVTAGSISKVGWSGLRIGWLRAPAPLVERTKHLHLATDLGTSVPSQLLALQLLPHYDDLARRSGRVAARLDRLRHRVVGTGDPRVADDAASAAASVCGSPRHSPTRDHSCSWRADTASASRPVPSPPRVGSPGHTCGSASTDRTTCSRKGCDVSPWHGAST